MIFKFRDYFSAGKSHQNKIQESEGSSQLQIKVDDVLFVAEAVLLTLRLQNKLVKNPGLFDPVTSLFPEDADNVQARCDPERREQEQLVTKAEI